VHLQIWIAMLAYLLLAYIKHSMKSALCLLEIHRLIRGNYSGNRPDAHDLSKIAVLKIYHSRTKASGR
jgi:hypothetical protein